MFLSKSLKLHTLYCINSSSGLFQVKQIPSQQGAALQRILNAGSAESSSCDILPIKWWVVYTKLVLSAAIYACITSFGNVQVLLLLHHSFINELLLLGLTNPRPKYHPGFRILRQSFTIRNIINVYKIYFRSKGVLGKS